MLKIFVLVVSCAASTSVLAQGLVKFANTPGTLISVAGIPPGQPVPPCYFALLSAPVGTTDRTQFIFAGVYATNTVLGRIQGGSILGVACNSTWPVGVQRDYFVVGWSANNGPVWNPSWLWTDESWSPGYYGWSSIATGISGGTDPVTQEAIPALALFSAAGIQSGFTLLPRPFPEPGSLSLWLCGALVVAVLRRPKN